MMVLILISVFFPVLSSSCLTSLTNVIYAISKIVRHVDSTVWPMLQNVLIVIQDSSNLTLRNVLINVLLALVRTLQQEPVRNVQALSILTQFQIHVLSALISLLTVLSAQLTWAVLKLYKTYVYDAQVDTQWTLLVSVSRIFASTQEPWLHSLVEMEANVLPVVTMERAYLMLHANTALRLLTIQTTWQCVKPVPSIRTIVMILSVQNAELVMSHHWIKSLAF